MIRPILASLALLALAPACVTQDVESGEMIPREGQRYNWDKVKKLAEHLQVGMSKQDVLFLMGSPAEMEETKWIYLPERYGILIPAEALQLDFEGVLLVKHEYRPIVLGTKL